MNRLVTPRTARRLPCCGQQAVTGGDDKAKQRHSRDWSKSRQQEVINLRITEKIPWETGDACSSEFYGNP